MLGAYDARLRMWVPAQAPPGTLVALRAQLARARGARYLHVDASEDSRPILARLGFEAIATTTPYVWTPR